MQLDRSLLFLLMQLIGVRSEHMTTIIFNVWCSPQNAVVKLKVVPPVHVSTGNSVNTAGLPGNQQVLAGNSHIIQETDTDRSFMEMTSQSVVDGYPTESSSVNIEGDSYDGWSEVKSVKSPRRRKGTSAYENEKVIRLIDHLCTLCVYMEKVDKRCLMIRMGVSG